MCLYECYQLKFHEFCRMITVAKKECHDHILYGFENNMKFTILVFWFKILKNKPGTVKIHQEPQYFCLN